MSLRANTPEEAAAFADLQRAATRYEQTVKTKRPGTFAAGGGGAAATAGSVGILTLPEVAAGRAQ